MALFFFVLKEKGVIVALGPAHRPVEPEPAEVPACPQASLPLKRDIKRVKA